MAKYQLTNLFKLSIVLTEKDGEGATVFNKAIDFRGGRSSPEFYGGTYHTQSEKEEELLDRHPWNRANGGWDFYKVEDPRAATKAEPVKATEEPEAETQLQEVDSRNVQEAALYLRQNFDLKASQVRTKTDVLNRAKELGITFPNLN